MRIPKLENHITNLQKLYTEKLQIDCNEIIGTVHPYWIGLGFDDFYQISNPELTSAWETIKKSNCFKRYELLS